MDVTERIVRKVLLATDKYLPSRISLFDLTQSEIDEIVSQVNSSCLGATVGISGGRSRHLKMD